MYRFFDLLDGVLSMDTQIQDEFGTIHLVTRASLYEDWISQRVEGEGSQDPQIASLKLRTSEMYHFLSILSLFDPQINVKQDGFSQIVSKTPPESWEKE